MKRRIVIKNSYKIRMEPEDAEGRKGAKHDEKGQKGSSVAIKW